MIGIALLAGAILGSREQLSRLGPDEESGPGVETGISDGPGASLEPENVVPAIVETPPLPPQGGMAATTPEADSAIVLSGDVRLMPYRQDGVFVGYEIVSAGSDGRFSAGDIITSVNGIAVEDSAAGGELLIAGLADQEARVQLRKR